MRRYAVTALLCIASEEDDDGNAAEGNTIEQRTERPGRRQQPREPATRLAGGAAPKADIPRLDDPATDAAYRTLIGRARVAETIEDGHELLETWAQNEARFERLRGGDAWKLLEEALGAGLRRSLGTDPAAAFVAALRATTPQNVEALQTHWDGKWAGTLAAMEHEAPETFALLRRHRDSQVARVRGPEPNTVWEIISRDGKTEDLRRSSDWVQRWTQKIRAVEEADKPLRERRATLWAMKAANETQFVKINAAGYDAAVGQVERAIAQADERLARLQGGVG